MQGYGPINLTFNTVTGQAVDASADRILLSNRSIYDVLVSFQTTQPVAASALSSVWPVIVHAGDQIIYTLRKADTTPTPLLLSVGEFWSGNVWLCPSVFQSGLATTGISSVTTQFFVTALHPGDPTPALSARPTWADISSQLRVITLTVPPTDQFYTAHNVAGANLYGTRYAYAQGPGSTRTIHVYCHWLFACVFTASQNIDFQYGPVGYDAANAIIPGSFTAIGELQVIGTSNTPFMFPVPAQAEIFYQNTYGAQTLTWPGFAINVISVSAALSATWSAGITIDNESNYVVPPIGQGRAAQGQPPM